MKNVWFVLGSVMILILLVVVVVLTTNNFELQQEVETLTQELEAQELESRSSWQQGEVQGLEKNMGDSKEMTGEWLVYSGDGFSFRYPPDWEIGDRTLGSDNVMSKDFGTEVEEVGDGGGYYVPVSGGAFVVLKGEKFRGIELDAFCRPGGSFSISVCEDTTFLGYEAKRIVYKTNGTGREYSTEIIFVTEEHYFRIGKDYESTNLEVMELLDKIQSTFELSG
jgi:hypothetical protein